MGERRLTTREIAPKLGCRPVHAVQLLKAAGVPYKRAGTAFLWDAPAVDRLLIAIGKGEVQPAQEARQ
jgi:hypothetical protein